MSQHDYELDNNSGAAFRADANNALLAIVSQNSGASEPSTPYAYMFWADTSAGMLKQRNAANNAWVSLWSLQGQYLEKEGADVASASSCNIWALDGNTRHLTGNTDIDDFATAPQAGAVMRLISDGTAKLKQSTNLNLNGGGADVTLAVGDMVIVYADTTTQMDAFVIRKSGEAVVPPSSLSEQYIYIRDEKTTGTDGGTFTSGAWRKRDLNTEVIDNGNNASLASSVITLQPGTYRFKARCPADQVGFHKCKLINTTDTIEYVGSSEYSNTGSPTQTSSVVSGRFTIATAKNFELQHRCATTKNTTGFGEPSNFSVAEVYAEIEFWKEI